MTHTNEELEAILAAQKAHILRMTQENKAQAASILHHMLSTYSTKEVSSTRIGTVFKMKEPR